MEYGEFVSTFKITENYKPVCEFKSWRADYALEAAKLLGITEEFMKEMRKGKVIQKFVEPEKVASSKTPVACGINYSGNTRVFVSLSRNK